MELRHHSGATEALPEEPYRRSPTGALPEEQYQRGNTRGALPEEHHWRSNTRGTLQEEQYQRNPTGKAIPEEPYRSGPTGGALPEKPHQRSLTGGGLLEGHVGPAEAASRQQHVPDQRLDGGFPHQPDEEKLLDDRRRDGAEGRQAEQQLPEAVGLVGILTPHILL